MKKKRSWPRHVLSILSVLLLSSILSGCVTPPPDIPVCVEIHHAKGYCINTISSKEFAVDSENRLEGKTWWESRPTMLMLPPQSWAKLKTYIIMMCKQTGQCDKEVATWERTIQTVDRVVEGK